MTDITPVPQSESPGIEIMDFEGINRIEKMIRENKAAALRKEPPPHVVTKEMIRAALNGIKMQRGTMGAASSAAGGKSGSKKTGPLTIDLDDADL